MTKKNLWFGILALALVFSMMAVGCDLFKIDDNSGGGSGTFTLNGIPSEHNGKYAFLRTASYSDGVSIIGAQSLNSSTQTVTLCLISNGKVSIPLWTSTNGGSTFVRYSGNNTCDIVIALFNTQTYNSTTVPFGGLRLSSVSFTNGSAARSWSQEEYSDNVGGELGGELGGGDGSDMTWTAITNNPIDYVYTIAYGNGKFVAVGSDGYKSIMAYSSDGVNWTLTTSTLRSVEAIAYGNGMFVASDYGFDETTNGPVGKMAYSSDGITWTAAANSPFGTSRINAIAYGNNKFVAVGNDGKMAYSSDGITWTAVTNSPFGSFGSSYISAIAYGNNMFVAGCDVVYEGVEEGKMAYSSDGVTWTAVERSKFDSSLYTTVIAYGNGKFVAWGFDGDRSKMAWSSDGLNWTTVTNSTLVTSRIDTIAYGNNKFVAGGSQNAFILYSSDGIKWTAVENSTICVIRAIAYGNGTFVAGGSDGYGNGKIIAYSSDDEDE